MLAKIIEVQNWTFIQNYSLIFSVFSWGLTSLFADKFLLCLDEMSAYFWLWSTSVNQSVLFSEKFLLISWRKKLFTHMIRTKHCHNVCGKLSEVSNFSGRYERSQVSPLQDTLLWESDYVSNSSICRLSSASATSGSAMRCKRPRVQQFFGVFKNSCDNISTWLSNLCPTYTTNVLKIFSR